MSITRYIMSCDWDGCDFGPEETANPHGAWVTYEDHAAALKAAEADAARLRDSLLEYGWHHSGCVYGLNDRPCDCGYQAAIDAARGAP